MILWTNLHLNSRAIVTMQNIIGHTGHGRGWGTDIHKKQTPAQCNTVLSVYCTLSLTFLLRSLFVALTAGQVTRAPCFIYTVLNAWLLFSDPMTECISHGKGFFFFCR